jgi:hypothetical protein
MDLQQIEKILDEKYPAKQHADAVASYITKAVPNSDKGVIFLEGQKSKLYEDCDQEGATIHATVYAMPSNSLSYLPQSPSANAAPSSTSPASTNPIPT